MTRRPYKCECGCSFEVNQRISEPLIEKCIHCGGRAEIDYREWKNNNLSLTQPAFNDIEVNKQEWKKKGRRWTAEHKIKGLTN